MKTRTSVGRRLRTPLARVTRPRPIQIVATPGSGHGRALSTALELRSTLSARGHQAELEIFDDLASVTHWAETDDSQYSALVCVGGDGTQSATALAAARRSVPFLPLSSGFGNLFAREFGYPRTVKEAVDLLARGHVVYSDVGARNGELFLCQQSYGLIAEVQELVEGGARQPRGRWQRWLAYYRAALRQLGPNPPARLRVTVDGRPVAVDAALVIVANVKAFGPWLPLTPDASPVDGLFDVFVLRGGTRRDVFGTLLRRQLRLPGSANTGLVYRGRRVTVYGHRATRDQLEVLPGRLPVLVSPTTMAALLRGRPALGTKAFLAPIRVA